MDKIYFIIEENILKIYEEKNKKLYPYKIRGEENLKIISYEDVLEVKKYLFREFNIEKVEINLIYSKNVSLSFLGTIYSVFFLRDNIEINKIEKNLRFQSFNLDNLSNMYKILEEYLDFKIENNTKNDIYNLEEENNNKKYIEKINELEEKIKKLKKENRSLRIDLETEKFNREKERIIHELNQK